MATWTWVLGGIAPAGVERRELSRAYGRVLTRRVDGPATAQFSLDGRSDEAAEVVALGTDLHVYRDGIKLFRGRIGPENDSLDADRHRVQFTATDYRGMLDYRVVNVPGPRVFTAVDQGLIAWTLIQESQALTGGNMGITNGLGPTNGTVRDRSYDAGKPIGEAIEELGRVDGGFEWDIDTTLALRRWYPQRGNVTNVVLDYGGKLTTVERLLSPKDFANAVYVSGDSTLTPLKAVSATVATDPRGRWELSFGSTIKEQPTLVTRAQWLLDNAGTLRPDVSATFAADRWGGDADVGLGDTVQLVVNSGRLAINAAHRVVELVTVPGENGTERVTIGMVAA